MCPVLVVSVSVSSYAPCLVDSDALALLISSIPSGPYTLSKPSSSMFIEPWDKQCGIYVLLKAKHSAVGFLCILASCMSLS